MACHGPAMMQDIVLFSKPGCHLCDEVKGQLRRLQQTHHFDWREVNILEDPETFEKFKHEIPVLFIDGEKVFRYRLDEGKFLRRLRQHAGSQSRTDG